MNYKEIFQKFKDVKVLVVGDVGLDTYYVGDAKRISPEAPVPVVKVNETYSRLGLASNVVNNVISLGAKCEILGVVGRDSDADLFFTMLKGIGVRTDGMIKDSKVQTIKKIRVLASRLHHVVRVDFEENYKISKITYSKLLERYKKLIIGKDILIIQDYGKGFLNNEFTQKIISIAKSDKIPVFVDPSRKVSPSIYKGATLIKPNLDEFKVMNSLDLEVRYDYNPYAEKFLKKYNFKYLVLTKGKIGMSVFKKDQTIVDIASNNVEVYDVSGAGDTVISSLALAYASGLDIYDSSRFANIVAGIVVTKIGTSTVSPKEFLNFVNSK